MWRLNYIAANQVIFAAFIIQAFEATENLVHIGIKLRVIIGILVSLNFTEETVVMEYNNLII